MKKRQNISIYLLMLIGVFLAFASSCEKDDEEYLPNYQPGRLTEISYKDKIGKPYHNYQYIDNKVVDKYYYSENPEYLSNKVFTMEYQFKNGNLLKVYCSLEDESRRTPMDSLIYIYSESQIIEYFYSPSYDDTTVYFMENGKIKYSINKSSYTSSTDSSFYKWSGENLIGYEAHNYFLGNKPNVTNYVFEYSEIENPLFYSNIPKLGWRKMGGGLTQGDELSDLIPNCSRNFPLNLTVIFKNGSKEYVNAYSFKSKTFLNDNIPFEVSLFDYTTTDYLLIYEEL